MTEDPTRTASSPDAEIDSFVRRAREARKNLVPAFSKPTLEPEQRSRRTAFYGTALGIAASLVFALVSQGLNILLLPGVPIIRSVFDLLLVVVLIVAAGTIFSLVAVASLKIQNRIVAGGLVLLGLAIFYLYYRMYGNVIAGIMEGIGFLYFFILPILIAVLCLAPIMALIRWAARVQVEYFYRPIFYWKRALPVFALLAFVVLGGYLFVYSMTEQKAIRELNTMVRLARAARTNKMLPAPLQDMIGTPFIPYAKGSYSIVAEHNPLPNRVRTDGTPYVEPFLVSAQFKNGYWFTCRFTRTDSTISCFSYYKPPIPRQNG